MKLFEIKHTSRVQNMNITDAISHMKRECKESLKRWNDTPLWRGGDYSLPTGIGFGESIGATPRVSANTSNFYTLWIDNSPLWKEFPKRSQSFIGSTSEFTAGDYGDVALMIPFDSAKIGACPAYDLWKSFKLPDNESLEDLMLFCNRVVLLTKPSIDTHKMNYAELKKVFSEISYEEILEAATEGLKSGNDKIKFISKSILEDDLQSHMKKGQNLADMMDRLLVPAGFKNHTGKDFKIADNKEVFIEGKCFFILPSQLQKASQKEIDELHDALVSYPNLLKAL